MKRFLIEILNEGFTPEQANAVRGGAAETVCTCYGGANFTCTCNGTTFDNCDCNGATFSCTCHGQGSKYVCSSYKVGPT